MIAAGQERPKSTMSSWESKKDGGARERGDGETPVRAPEATATGESLTQADDQDARSQLPITLETGTCNVDRMAEMAPLVKRALDIMEKSVSLKPTKKARIEAVINMKDANNKSIRGFVKEIGGSTKDWEDEELQGVIPFEELKFTERHTPLDVVAFQSRLQSFNLKKWSSKPDCVSSFHCARYGWRLIADNVLVCVSCHRMMPAPVKPFKYLTYKEWVSCLEQSIRSTSHNTECIWIKSPTPASILQLPSGKEMQEYLLDALQTFQGMKSFPKLTSHYAFILKNIDLTGLKTKSKVDINFELHGVTPEMIEEMVLFLTVNGWTMDGSIEDTLKCHTCHRDVPLWLCGTSIARVEDQDLSCDLVLSNDFKEFDPVQNHWFWCPWRAYLQSENKSDSAVESEVIQDVTDENLFQNGSFNSNILKSITVEDYVRLTAKIDSDFKSNILTGPSHTMANDDVAVKTMFQVVNVLNSMVGKPTTLIPDFAPHSSLVEPNEIMVIKRSKSVSKNLFLATASMPLSTNDKKEVSISVEEENSTTSSSKERNMVEVIDISDSPIKKVIIKYSDEFTQEEDIPNCSSQQMIDNSNSSQVEVEYFPDGSLMIEKDDEEGVGEKKRERATILNMGEDEAMSHTEDQEETESPDRIHEVQFQIGQDLEDQYAEVEQRLIDEESGEKKGERATILNMGEDEAMSHTEDQEETESPDRIHEVQFQIGQDLEDQYAEVEQRLTDEESGEKKGERATILNMGEDEAMSHTEDQEETESPDRVHEVQFQIGQDLEDQCAEVEQRLTDEESDDSVDSGEFCEENDESYDEEEDEVEEEEENDMPPIPALGEESDSDDDIVCLN